MPSSSSPTKEFFSVVGEKFSFLDNIINSVSSSSLGPVFTNGLNAIAASPTYIYGAVVILIIYSVYRWIFGNYPKTPVQHWTNESHGFNRLRRAQYPPAYPNGWFKLCDLSDLDNDRIQCIDALGLHLVIYKSKTTKQPVIMDAYCPHLGAHLGIGGTVTDKGIMCPFHQWEISSEGCVANIPYCDGSAVPKGKVSKIYPHRVWMDMVFFYFHADNFTEEAERHAKINDGAQLFPPDWELRKIDAKTSGTDVETWTRFKTVSIKHNHHIMEISQNAPDYEHFMRVHDKFNFHPVLNLFTDRLFTIDHDTVMFNKEDEGSPALCKNHLYFTNKAVVNLHLPFGIKIPFSWVRQTTEVNFEGPGIVHFHIVTPIGSIHLIKTLLPLDHFKTFMEDAWYCDHKLPRFLGHLIAWTAKGALEQDKPIWENKRYSYVKPLLVKGDGPFQEFRKWWLGFYSDNSQQWSDEHQGDSLVW